MTSIHSQFLWQISEAHLPELQFKLRSLPKPVDHILPIEFDSTVKASGVAKGWNDYLARIYSTDKNVLVLPVEGEMSRSGYWGYGNDFLTRQINAAATDSDFKGIVLKFNTPGGTADSTPAFAQAVANFSAQKPIVAQTGYCASAGYYVASQCTEILIEDQASSSIGSIGTLIIVENYVEYLKQMGISMEIIRATASVDKALVNPYEPLSDEARANLQKICNDCQKEFAGAVKRGRAGRITSDEVFTGKMYGANDALKLGLVDGKGDLSAAVKRVFQLSK